MLSLKRIEEVLIVFKADISPIKKGIKTYIICIIFNYKKKPLHKPGIEPGSIAWQATILPLDHLCFPKFYKFLFNIIYRIINYNSNLH